MLRNVLEYLENDVLNFKDKIAVIDETKKYTYGEFSNLSRKIGSFLATKTNMRMPVAVLMEKSADTLCAFMGIVYAGCFYVQLNPEFPASRHEQILSVLNAKLIITDEAHKEAAVNLIGEENTLLISDLMNDKQIHELFTTGQTIVDVKLENFHYIISFSQFRLILSFSY